MKCYKGLFVLRYLRGKIEEDRASLSLSLSLSCTVGSRWKRPSSATLAAPLAEEGKISSPQKPVKMGEHAELGRRLERGERKVIFFPSFFPSSPKQTANQEEKKLAPL